MKKAVLCLVDLYGPIMDQNIGEFLVECREKGMGQLENFVFSVLVWTKFPQIIYILKIKAEKRKKQGFMIDLL